jgi:DNA polymerase-1
MILVEREKEFVNIFEGKPVLGVDIETTGVCPFENKLRLVQLHNGEETMVIDVFKTGKEATAKFLKPILESEHISKTFQNGKFDLKFLKEQLGIDVTRCYDTFLAAKLLENHIHIASDEGDTQKTPKGWFGLGELAKRYAGIEIDKSEQMSDWSGVLEQSQYEYASKDVEILFPIREEQTKRLKKDSLTKAAKLEFDAILPVAWQELSGFYLNFDEWVQLSAGFKEKSDEAKSRIFEILSPYIEQGSLYGEPNINLNSHKQIQQYFSLAGVPMPKSTREFELTPLKDKYELIKLLLDYRGYEKAYGTFGESYQQYINPVTGRIHCDVYQLGSVTGRMSASNPNLSQIPANNLHRGCFQARPGYKLLSLDYSQEELRILADKSRDAAFKSLFLTGGDFHAATACKIFNKAAEQISAEERTMAKRVNFGVSYCIGAGKLAMMLGIEQFEAQTLIKTYFNTFKGVKNWIDFQKVQVVKNYYARTSSGRRCTYDFDDSVGFAKAQAQRYAVNFPIQGTASDILKLALANVYKVCQPYGDDIRLVNVVHDEMNFEIKDDIIEEVAPRIKQAMIDAGHYFVKSVEIKVDQKIQQRWLKEDENKG